MRPGRVESLRQAGLAWLRKGQARGLLAQLAWFNRLRFGAIGGVVVVTIFGQGLGMLRDSRPLFALSAIALLLNLYYEWRLPRLAAFPERRIRRHVDLQIGVDLVVLTAMLHWSGGVTNPFVLFYLFHAFIAALLLSIGAASIVALAALLAVGALAAAERFEWLPHHPIELGWFDLFATPPQALLAAWFVFALTFVFSIYFVATVLHRLRRSEADLVALDRQLGQSEKLASVGTLAAGVSHEINNPVGVIQSKVQILRYRIADGDDKDSLLRELDVIEKHAKRIGVITAGLLTFSRETPFELRPLDLNSLVEEGVDLVRLPFQSAGVPLRVDLDATAPRIDGSPNHLLQVLVNILLNARDASTAGQPVTVSTQIEAGGVAIRIRDEGSGIPADVLPKIFDPFFTTKDVDRGTGLGLAITHGIVERHGGRILVASEVGHGSTFTILLPTPHGIEARDR